MDAYHLEFSHKYHQLAQSLDVELFAPQVTRKVKEWVLEFNYGDRLVCLRSKTRAGLGEQLDAIRKMIGKEEI